jgi:hypothetical protein
MKGSIRDLLLYEDSMIEADDYPVFEYLNYLRNTEKTNHLFYIRLSEDD